jgi:hypothetical protein
VSSLAEPPVYRYTIETMPPSRLGRRWRWTLFHGDRLLAAGWRLSERRALQGLRTAAARASHEALGLKVLRPDRTWPDTPFLPGATVRLEAGPVACVLAPADIPAAAVA